MSVLKANEQINLTSITNFDDAIRLHLEDSLCALNEIKKCKQGSVADFGCGGGFPGVPLFVASKRTTYLIDSRAKKIKTVKECLEQAFSLSNISFDMLEKQETFWECACNLDKSRPETTHEIIGVACRIEELKKHVEDRFSCITARALSSLSSLVELASPCLEIGGNLVCLKGRIESDELEDATQLHNKTGLKIVAKRDFYLSDSCTKRSIIVFEKTKEPSILLPRRIGLAQKKPLKP